MKTLHKWTRHSAWDLSLLNKIFEAEEVYSQSYTLTLTPQLSQQLSMQIFSWNPLVNLSGTLEPNSTDELLATFYSIKAMSERLSKSAANVTIYMLADITDIVELIASIIYSPNSFSSFGIAPKPCIPFAFFSTWDSFCPSTPSSLSQLGRASPLSVGTSAPSVSFANVSASPFGLGKLLVSRRPLVRVSAPSFRICR